MSKRIIIPVFILIILIACASAPRYRGGSSSYKKRVETSLKKQTGGKWKPGDSFTGIASFYGKDFHGKLTANGEYFDMYGLTAAHKTLPLNTVIRVTNLANNKSIIVRINDRGPYVAGRILDLSYGAALKLGFVNEGTAKVKVEIIELGDDEYMKHVD